MKKLKEIIGNIKWKRKTKKLFRSLEHEYQIVDTDSVTHCTNIPVSPPAQMPAVENSPRTDDCQQWREEVPVWDATVEASADVVRNVLEELEVKYEEHPGKYDGHTFEMKVRDENKDMHARIILLKDHGTCRIDVIYLFRAEREMAYVLCKELARENYPKRYGGLKYDHRDGEMLYQYSFPLFDSMSEAYFQDLFMLVMGAAGDNYDYVKRFANGRLYQQERKDCICEAQNLIIELSK